MKKFAIAIPLIAGILFCAQAQAGGPAVIGAVEGAVVGSQFGGAHGAVAGAIIGAIIGSSVEDNYDRSRVRSDRGYARDEPRPAYYAPPVSYQPDYAPRYEARYEPRYELQYEPQYEPRRVVYVSAPVYERYPVSYVNYPAPVYVERFGNYRRGHHSSRHHRGDYRHRY